MSSTDRIRGGLAGVACGVLAIAAHGIEGGLPRSSGLALLLVVSGAVGAGVGSSAGRGRLRLFGLLALGQLVEHLALVVAAGPAHTHQAMASTGRAGSVMFAAHAAATLLCALLIAAAERVYRAVSRVVWTLLTRFAPNPVSDDRLVRAPRAAEPRGAAGLRGAISRRGPPISAAVAITF
jgi:hypothetical protein